MNKLLLAITLLFISATVSLAASANNDFYGEFLLGSGNPESTLTGQSTFSGSSVSFGFRGGYQLNQHLALEIGYHDYGAAKDTVSSINTRSKADTSASNFGIKGSFPIDNDISLNLQFGLSSWKYDLALSDTLIPGVVNRFEDSDTTFFYGLGATYDLEDNLYLGFEFTSMSPNIFVNSTSIDFKLQNFSFSVGMNF